jgi:hypothetical protein
MLQSLKFKIIHGPLGDFGLKTAGPGTGAPAVYFPYVKALAAEGFKYSLDKALVVHTDHIRSVGKTGTVQIFVYGKNKLGIILLGRFDPENAYSQGIKGFLNFGRQGRNILGIVEEFFKKGFAGHNPRFPEQVIRRFSPVMLFQYVPQGELKKTVYLNPGTGTKAGPGNLHIGPHRIVPVKFILSLVFHVKSS